MNSNLNYCTICKGVKGLKRMNDIFLKQKENILSFIDALMSCFNIQFLEINSKKHNTICEKCADKLSYCCAFRKDVEVAHRQLYSASVTDDKGNISKISETPIEVKVEPQYLNDGNMPKSNYFLEGFINFAGRIETADDDCDDFKYDEQNLNENSSDSDWSVKTAEILRATGYWKELEIIKSKPKSAIPVLDDNAVTCPLCLERFNLHRNVVVHFKQHFASFLCEICGKTYVSNSCLNNHKIIHKGLIHKCSECDKSFPTIRHLKTHMKQTHRKVKRFVCYVCNERFLNPLLRRKHLVMEHNLQDERNHCPLCDYTWLNISNYRKHIKKKHFDTWNIKCAECSLVFIKHHQLKRHLVTHTDVRDHKCEVCDKAFNRRSALNEHIKLHLNIKSYICSECNKGFTQRAALYGHMKTHNKQPSKINTGKRDGSKTDGFC